MSSEKPTLPSIQLMLEGASIDSTTTRVNKSNHRRNASDVVGHMENLSLSTPSPVEPSTTNNTTTWPTPFRPTPLYQYPFQNHRSARNLHSRSFSDYTHPYVTTPPPTSHHQQTNGLLTPYQQQHRRAISTSTLDLMMQHTLRPDSYNKDNNTSIHSTTTPPPALQPSYSTSTLPQSPTLSIKTPSSVDEQHLFDTDEDDIHHRDDERFNNDSRIKQQLSSGKVMMMAGSTSTTTTTTITTSTTTNNNNNNNNNGKDNNKYQCPYCQKGFSRPSSLRIHTYSHTGEKPFTCPEPNCDRSFSVQSNMRRHIRVHKLNGRHLKMRRSPPPIKPLAAKPSWMNGTQDALPPH